MQIKNRITELRIVKASDLLPNPRNWRGHPEAQANALRAVLADVGFADAAIGRDTPEGVMLIDGHLRTEVASDSDIPVLIVDLSKEEADKVLATQWRWTPRISQRGSQRMNLTHWKASLRLL